MRGKTYRIGTEIDEMAPIENYFAKVWRNHSMELVGHHVALSYPRGVRAGQMRRARVIDVITETGDPMDDIIEVWDFNISKKLKYFMHLCSEVTIFPLPGKPKSVDKATQTDLQVTKVGTMVGDEDRDWSCKDRDGMEFHME